MASFVIVDDSKTACRILRNLLVEAGHEVLAEGSNGLEGYDLYSQYKPDIITLDITMPLVGGLECLKNLIKNFPEVKAVVVTSVGKDSLIDEAKTAGAKAVLIKPFDKDEALDVIASVIG